ncbi:outer membrane protein [Helicobacter pylori]|nr:outer membrane protein [Helicobacter pylori]
MKQNLKPFKMIKENLMTQSQKVRFLAPLSLALSLSFNPVGAEEDGGFMTFGYELGQVVQQVKNPGKIKAEELAGLLNSNATNNTNGASVGGNVAGTLGNLYMDQLQQLFYSYNTANILKIFEHDKSKLQGSLDVFKAFYSASQNLLKNIQASIFTTPNSNTTSENLSTQISNLTLLNSYAVFMNSFLNANNKVGGPFQHSSQISNILSQASAVLGPSGESGSSQAFLSAALAQHVFNSANAGNDLSAKEFTSLVQNIVNDSQTTLDRITKANQGATNPVNPTLLDNATNTLAKVTALNNELKANPWLGNFAAGNSSQVNAFNGFITKIGYKQFFGENKNVGLRYYGFFSYNGAGVGNGPTYNQVNLLTYGVGTDVLYNVFSRSFGSRSLNAGFFGGIQLAGDTYISTLRNSPQLVNRPTATKFQFLFDVGLRMNFGILKKDLKSHNQHSIEIGVQIPTIYNTYYKAGGAEVKYFRPYSVYWVYGYAF